jgi:hypothetical protein
MDKKIIGGEGGLAPPISHPSHFQWPWQFKFIIFNLFRIPDFGFLHKGRSLLDPSRLFGFKILKGSDTPDAIRQRDAIFRFSLSDNFDPSLNFPNI